MPFWLQHLLVLTLVGACLIIVGVQAWSSLHGKRSRLGSCCAKGCPPQKPQAGAERIIFFPADMLRKKR